ncbi:hypothetical protein FKM82_022589 [Ascaphus truei]
MDVEGLYTSINHDAGIQAVMYFLNTRGIFYKAHNVFMAELIEFVLTHNYFLFANTYYHQTQGMAMGTKCAPSYANLYLGWWEAALVFTGEMEPYTSHIDIWVRYIDDVMMLWNGSIEKLREFVGILNSNELNLYLTLEHNPNTIVFLDVCISRGSDNIIDTTIHRKATAINSLLTASSHHPRSLINGIPVGQFLRLKRN